MANKPPSAAKANTVSSGGFVEGSLGSPIQGGGIISSGFGSRNIGKTTNGQNASKDHKGIDIAVPTGTTVVAAADGIVENVTSSAAGYGNRIVIRHDDGSTETTYNHLSKTGVTIGQRVKRGEPIGLSGATGNVSGPHLHFEVYKEGVRVDPTKAGLGKLDAGKAAARAQNVIQAVQEKKYKELMTGFDQEATLASLRTGDHFIPNAAGNFDNLSYVWRLFLMPDVDFLTANALDSNSVTNVNDFYKSIEDYTQITICQSGVTNYSIDSIEMEAAIGPNFQSSSTSITKFSMKVTEPNGVNFLDALRRSCVNLGIKNYNKCPYFLELTFKGYETDGSINTKPFVDQFPNGGRWLWAVQITDIGVKLDAGGGSYAVEMMNFNNSAHLEQYNLVPSILNVSGDGTLGGWFNDFCAKMNQDWKNRMGGEIVKYDVKFHAVDDLLTKEQIAAFPINPAEVHFNPEQTMTDEGNVAGQIPPGMPISAVLDTVMQSCETVQRYAKDSVADVRSPDDSNTKVNGKGFRSSIIWRVETEVHLPKYDTLYQVYYHNITLHIYGYRNSTTVLSTQDDATNTTDVQKARLALLAKSNALKKKYEYIFTGQNTEVIDMDLAFNLAWSVQLPRLIDAGGEQAAPQALVDPKKPETKDKPVDPLATPKTIEDARKNPENKDTVIARQGTNKQILDDKVAALASLRQKSLTDDSSETRDAIVKAEQEVKEAQLNVDKATQFTQTAREISDAAAKDHSVPPQKTFQRLYGEEVMRDTTEPKVAPISIEVVDSSVSNGIVGQYHPGKSLYGAVLNQVYGPMTSQFMNISLTIKGDPYWIGPGSFEDIIRKRTDKIESQYPDFSSHANCILFRMKYPLGMDGNNNVIINTNETVTGVYQVNSISHRFDGGKFTQVLNCTYIQMIDLFRTLYGQDNKSGQGTL